MSRKVHRLTKLQSARFVDTGPFHTEPKLKGAALEGIKYQAKVHQQLNSLHGNLLNEQWIKFKDAGEWRYCRPDSISETHDRIVVVEAKLSLRQLQKGLAQLRLYKPILEHIYDKPVVCVLAFKHWIVGTSNCLPMIAEIREMLWTPLPQLKTTMGWNFISGGYDGY